MRPRRAWCEFPEAPCRSCPRGAEKAGQLYGAGEGARRTNRAGFFSVGPKAPSPYNYPAFSAPRGPDLHHTCGNSHHARRGRGPVAHQHWSWFLQQECDFWHARPMAGFRAGTTPVSRSAFPGSGQLRFAGGGCDMTEIWLVCECDTESLIEI